MIPVELNRAIKDTTVMHPPLLSQSTKDQLTPEAEQLSTMIARELNASTDADIRLAGDVQRLVEILSKVLLDQMSLSAMKATLEVIRLAKARRASASANESELEGYIRALSTKDSRAVLRALCIQFDLANLAEDQQRIRVLLERESKSWPAPRAESIGEAIGRLKQAGFSPQQIQQLLNALEIEMVFTAHPTEAKRQSIRGKLRRLRQSLSKLDGAHPRERADLHRRMHAELTSWWQTDFVRPRRPTVIEEVKRGLGFTATLWNVVPEICRDLRQALAENFPNHEFQMPTLVRFGSWMGGDRDGNPFVTSDVTAEALMQLRRNAMQNHLQQCTRMISLMSESDQKAAVMDSVRSAVASSLEQYPQVVGAVKEISVHELYRQFLKIVQWRLSQTSLGDLDHSPAGAYADAAELRNDLELLSNSLRTGGSQSQADTDLRDWICQLDVFGFHTARLDVRQESSKYQQAIADIYKVGRICSDYLSLSESGRQKVLGETMQWPWVLPDEALSENTREILSMFRLLANAHARFGSAALGAHIVSMTHHPSDLLAVLWLAEWAGGGRGGINMPLVPLFETIDDLQRSAGTMQDILANPLYRRRLGQQGNVQMVMIGYSDSTKDGGYLTAQWELFKGQDTLVKLAQNFVSESPIRLVFFHGRGGSLGRGGGPAARGIQSLPAGSVNGKLRVTEQGEVLAERYDDPRIAHRHFEQVIGATILVTALPQQAPRDSWRQTLSELAGFAYSHYREMVEHADFLDYFQQATPIAEIEQLPIGSRPARRGAKRSLKDLRAIPWVFSWTQNRHLLPAWYGLGSAIERLVASRASAWEDLKEMYNQWPFFRGTIDNAVMALAKADMGIAMAYAKLGRASQDKHAIWHLVQSEFDRSRDAVLKITGTTEFLQNTPWLARSINVRNPFVDPLNLMQVDFLRKMRGELSEDQQIEMQELMRLTIQGIASGLRTTG